RRLERPARDILARAARDLAVAAILGLEVLGVKDLLDRDDARARLHARALVDGEQPLGLLPGLRRLALARLEQPVAHPLRDLPLRVAVGGEEAFEREERGHGPRLFLSEGSARR